MAEPERATKTKNENADQKHRIRQQDSQPLFERPFVRNNSPFSLRETPFYPRIDEHTAMLSRIPSATQRNHFIIQLHQTYGNRYVQRLMESIKVQAKLTINDPGDIYEHESDRVADLVTRAATSQVRRQAEEEEEIEMQPTGEEEEVQAQRQAEEEPEEEEPAAMKQFSAIQRQDEEEEVMTKPSSEIQQSEERVEGDRQDISSILMRTIPAIQTQKQREATPTGASQTDINAAWDFVALHFENYENMYKTFDRNFSGRLAIVTTLGGLKDKSIGVEIAKNLLSLVSLAGVGKAVTSLFKLAGAGKEIAAGLGGFSKEVTSAVAGGIGAGGKGATEAVAAFKVQQIDNILTQYNYMISNIMNQKNWVYQLLQMTSRCPDYSPKGSLKIRMKALFGPLPVWNAAELNKMSKAIEFDLWKRFARKYWRAIKQTGHIGVEIRGATSAAKKRIKKEFKIDLISYSKNYDGALKLGLKIIRYPAPRWIR